MLVFKNVRIENKLSHLLNKTTIIKYDYDYDNMTYDCSYDALFFKLQFFKCIWLPSPDLVWLNWKEYMMQISVHFSRFGNVTQSNFKYIIIVHSVLLRNRIIRIEWCFFLFLNLDFKQIVGLKYKIYYKIPFKWIMHVCICCKHFKSQNIFPLNQTENPKDISGLKYGYFLKKKTILLI